MAGREQCDPHLHGQTGGDENCFESRPSGRKRSIGRRVALEVIRGHHPYERTDTPTGPHPSPVPLSGTPQGVQASHAVRRTIW